jgi:uncharacterized peroxidase-related enzyme
MSRIQAITPEQATGHTAEVYSAITKSLGKVPNLFQAVGVNSNSLQTLLGLGPSIQTLSGAEKETIALVVAQQNNCGYCLSAHTALAGMNGISKDESLNIRKGNPEGVKQKALVNFVKEIVTERGHVSDKTLNEFRAAGYSDTHIPDVLMAVVLNFYTNFFNHINQTEIDFPVAEKI